MSKEIFTGETEAERRRYPRLPLKLNLSFQCLDKGNVSPLRKNAALDLGAGGLAMRSDRALPPDQLVMVNLFLPLPEIRDAAEKGMEAKEDDCTRVDILTRVAWCARAKPKGYLLGLQFLDLDRDDRKTLKKFLEDYQLYQTDLPWAF